MDDISALRVHGGLAYLSANDTSTTSPSLTNEAVHLTGAFYLAGYQHVISARWPLGDRIAAIVALEFYSHLTSVGTPDISLAAHALHHVIHALRNRRPKNADQWASLVHTGM